MPQYLLLTRGEDHPQDTQDALKGWNRVQFAFRNSFASVQTVKFPARAIGDNIENP